MLLLLANPFITVAVNDDTALTLGEAAAVSVSLDIADTASLTASDVVAADLSSAVTDTAALGLDEAASVVPSAAAGEIFTGGFIVAFEREMARRDRERRKRLDDEEEAQRLADEVEREIASLLHAQEAREAEAREMDRLKRLVERYAQEAASQAFSERVMAAFARAQAQMTASALLALDREVRRQMEEEEMAVLMAVAMID